MIFPTFYIQSLGCKVNQYDGGSLRRILLNFGFQPAEEGNPPGVFIVNSCAVTGRASQKARQAMHAVRRKWPETKIVLAGCEARLRKIQDSPSDEADAALSPDFAPRDVHEMLSELGFSPAPLEISSHAGFGEIPGERTRAFIKVQDGCSHFCSYCIVPHLRGPERSKSISEAVAEAGNLAERGRREIVVSGIHLGRFEPDLLQLLKRLETIPGLDRIRLSSIEPNEVNDGLLDWLNSSPKACPNLHLPLQAGHDEVLRRMGRTYTTAQFAAVLESVRRRMPDISINTDFIVGFPGETEEQFAGGLRFVESMGFSRMHIFRFSPRKGTPAADFPHQIASAEKKERAQRTEAVRKKLSERFHRRFLGRPVEVLWETRENGLWRGFSREYAACIARFPGETVGKNTISSISVQSFTSEFLSADEEKIQPCR